MLRKLFQRSLTQVSSSVWKPRGLEEFFHKDGPIVVGRAWEARELRQKSWDDLHKLWYVLLKEKNILYSQKQMMRTVGRMMERPDRIVKVRKSMCRIKQVLTERCLQEEDAEKKKALRRWINDL
eukprot:TRINITY_DN20670_c0_g1_i1.p1 TRINITY_DN20670_c0_g1~~TRINITY_DN20670_c0_g1_i1.p1  ORF type:complete len:124 (+),score=24.45 TRINITY_DN20670_c0_g1_i1:135-506(+)